MLRIDMLPAGHGDALVVEYGPSSSKVHRLLVDAGTIHSWDAVRARLASMPNERYEAFVITHVDEDHIGGALQLLGDPTLRARIRDVWFNGYTHVKAGSKVLGPVDGERLTRMIRDGGYLWNQAFEPVKANGVGAPVVVPTAVPTDALPSVRLPGGAVLHMLSPTGPKLKAMEEVWKDVVSGTKGTDGANLVAGEGTDLVPVRPPRRHRKIPPFATPLTPKELKRLAKTKPGPDRSEANGSSIAFLLEYDRKRILLGADAHADVLESSLRRFGEQVGEERVRIHLAKLSHHGSAANLTEGLVDAMDCGKYLLSSNGENFGHPDDAAIARVILHSKRAPTFYANFRSDRTLPWLAAAPDVGAAFVLPKEGAAGLRVTAS
jgi:beta-lactamase superfamily II metal-dependent hydrolase